MKKIKDRIVLGIVVGLAGVVSKTIIDEISLKKKISKRSYRETAAGIWVKNRRQVKSFEGNILGMIMDLGLSMVGAIAQVYLITKSGKDHLISKGLFFGVAFGATITAMLSGFKNNKVGPKDPRSNLSYVTSNAVYGIVCTLIAGWLGDKSLFDEPPANNYLHPTKDTSEEGA